MRKKILFIGHSSALLGGAEDEFQKLLEYLNGYSDIYEIDAIFPEGDRAKEFSKYCTRYKTYERIFLPASRRPLIEYYGYLKYYRKHKNFIKSFIKGVKYDLCLVNTSVMPWFVKFLSKEKIKLIIFVRETVKPDIIRKYLYKYYSKKGEYIIFANERNRNEYIKITGKRNSVTLYYSIKNNKLISRSDSLKNSFKSELIEILLNNNIFKLMISGSVYEVKNQIMGVKVLNEMKVRNYKLPIIIIKGDNSKDNKYLNKLRKMILKNNLSRNFYFLGFISKEEYYYLFECIDVLLITSLEEGCPLVLFESMKLGKPVISTKVGGVEDLIENGKNGFLVNNYVEMAEKINLIMNDTDLKSKFGKNLKNLFEQQFSYEKVYDKYIEIINKVLSIK